MSKTKCIIRQDWTTRDASGNLIDRHAAVYVTNEDGTPTIYDSIKEARAEIIANYGRDANSAGILHSHAVDDYTGNVHDGYVVIIRENDPEYTEAIEQAKQDAAPEYIEPEAIQTVAGHTIYKSVDPVTGDLVYTVAGRDFWTVAEARYFAQCNPVTTDDAAEAEELKDADVYANYAEAFASVAEYAASEGQASDARKAANLAREEAEKAAASAEYSRRTYYADHETSAYARTAVEIRADHVRRAEEAAARAEEAAQRAEALASIEDPKTRKYFTAHAIAHQWSAEETAQNLEHMQKISAANAAALALLDAYAEAIGEHPHEDDDETRAAYRVARDEITGTSQRATDYDRETVDLMTETIARSARRPDLSKYESMPYLEIEPAPVYQPAELLAYLGEPEDYDVEAIEAEATAYDPATGRRVWAAFGDDLASICERHQTATYYPAAV